MSTPAVIDQLTTDKPAEKASEKPSVEQQFNETMTRVNEFRSLIGKEKDKEKDKDKKPDVEKKEETPSEEPKKEEKKSEPKVEESKKPEPTEEEEPAPRRRRRAHTQDIVDAAVAAASKASAETAAKLKESPKAEEKPQEVALGFELDKKMAYRVKLLEELETLDPKHKGAKSKYLAWAKDLATYQDKWERDHDGEEFDPDAPEHNRIFAKEPDFDESDLDDARWSMREKAKKGTEAERLEPKLKEIEAQLAEQKVQPMIHGEGRRMFDEVLGAVDGELLKAARAGELDKALNEDPIAAQAIGVAAQTAMPFISEVIKLREGASKFNPENPIHAAVVEFAQQMEAEILDQPHSKQTRNGKSYAPIAEYEAMSKAERARHWSFAQPEELINFRIHQAVEDAKNVLKAEEKKAAAWEKRFGKRNGAPPAAPETKAVESKPEAKVEPPLKREEQSSPSSSAKGTVDTSASPNKSGPVNFGDIFLSRFGN